MDFHMLQTGHGDRTSLSNTVLRVTQEYAVEPAMPVINSEVCYEGIGEQCRQEVQRLMFWTCLLSGACGHTYGANGLWQVNSRQAAFGPSPHGMSYGKVPWEEAYQLPGSAQVGLGKRLLERYPWWQFQPHPEWIEPHWSEADFFGAYGAGIPGQVRVFYLWGAYRSMWKVTGIEPGVSYRASLFSPVDGEEVDLGPVVADAKGEWEMPLGSGHPKWRMMPIWQDWVLVLDAR
jgi:hypothetical protein